MPFCSFLGGGFLKRKKGTLSLTSLLEDPVHEGTILGKMALLLLGGVSSVVQSESTRSDLLVPHLDKHGLSHTLP